MATQNVDAGGDAAGDGTAGKLFTAQASGQAQVRACCQASRTASLCRSEVKHTTQRLERRSNSQPVTTY